MKKFSGRARAVFTGAKRGLLNFGGKIKNAKRRGGGRYLWTPAAISCVFAAWAIIAAVTGDGGKFPSAGATLSAAGKLLSSGAFYSSAGFSIGLAAAGFLLALVLADAMAVLSALFKAADGLIFPVMAVLRSVPTMSVLLVGLVWFGRGSAFVPAAIAFCVVFPFMFFAARNELRETAADLTDLLRQETDKKIDFFKVLFWPRLKSLAPGQLGGGLPLNIKIALAAEAQASVTAGVGAAMQRSGQPLIAGALEGGAAAEAMGAVFAWTLAVVAVGFTIEAAARIWSARLSASDG